jgi:hypothetical protein
MRAACHGGSNVRTGIAGGLGVVWGSSGSAGDRDTPADSLDTMEQARTALLEKKNPSGSPDVIRKEEVPWYYLK